MNDIPIVIPSYEPDETLITLADGLAKTNNRVIIVNDGSEEKYDKIFDKAIDILGKNGTLLSYKENHGKGYALKTAFSYILDNFPKAIGAVTADSDGQHSIEAILDVKERLLKNPSSLILGVRSFKEKSIPWKSAFGNKICINILSYASGIKVKDTQCGLRGVPLALMGRLLKIKENRFEFETQMLIEASGDYPITEAPISTIYIDNNSNSHFKPISDSFKIVVTICKKFFKYALSSVFSSILDIFMFWLWCTVLPIKDSMVMVAAATVLARIVSLSCNYLLNYKLVFNRKGMIKNTAGKYFIISMLQMTASACLVMLGVKIFFRVSKVLLKVIVDTTLFFISYIIQGKYVFGKDR